MDNEMQSLDQKQGSNKRVIVLSVITGAVVIAVIITILFIFVFNAKPKDQIIGKWSISGSSSYITFEMDGTCTITGGYDNRSVSFSYSVLDNNDLVYGLKTYRYDSNVKFESNLYADCWYIDGNNLFIGESVYIRN